MKRLEIIGNRSIEEDLFEILEKKEMDMHYTKIPVVHGKGSSDPKMGDSVWPEENFLLIIYCENAVADQAMEAIKELKHYFPDEGLKVFEINVDSCV